MNAKHQYSERAFRFLMEKSNQWKCSPQEAEARIIEEAARYAELRRERRLQRPVCYSGVSDGSSAVKSNAYQF